MAEVLQIHQLLAEENLGDPGKARYMAQREAVREALLANKPHLEFKFRGRYYIVHARTSGGLDFRTRQGSPVREERVQLMVDFLAQPLIG